MNNYSLGDFIIRIKNAAMASRKEVITPYAKVLKAVADLLAREGFLSDVKVLEDGNKKSLQVKIAKTNRMTVFTDVTLISKPSLRVYATASQVEKAQKRSGLGIIIVSTSSGVMSGKEAMKKGLGGELLFKVW